MSLTVLALAKSFIKERLSADQFVDAYMETWKYERDSDVSQNDNTRLSECLSSVFCLADLYNPESDRDDYELDEEKLRHQVFELIKNLEKFTGP